MKEFFNVVTLNDVIQHTSCFPQMPIETIDITQSLGRIIAEDIIAQSPLPEFPRATMDGYAVYSASTFGASESNPALLSVVDTIEMGKTSKHPIQKGEAARISTGGMLPEGADCVVMIEHTEIIDNYTIEVYKSAAPLQHMMEPGEDIYKGQHLIKCGTKLKSSSIGLLSALGLYQIKVYKKPCIAIISTGDELVPIHENPPSGKIRDINSYSLSALIQELGAHPIMMGIIHDDFDSLYSTCLSALKKTDMVIISGGSSVGVRDLTIDVIQAIKGAQIFCHGVSIRPGKPTILAQINNQALWGLPGQVTSAMIVFRIIVQPFIEHISGVNLTDKRSYKMPATLTRNIASVQGRTDFVRVKLFYENNQLWADPIIGKSGFIQSIASADGLITIDMNVEGLNKGDDVWIDIL